MRHEPKPNNNGCRPRHKNPLHPGNPGADLGADLGTAMPGMFDFEKENESYHNNNNKYSNRCSNVEKNTQMQQKEIPKGNRPASGGGATPAGGAPEGG